MINLIKAIRGGGFFLALHYTKIKVKSYVQPNGLDEQDDSSRLALRSSFCSIK